VVDGGGDVGEWVRLCGFEQGIGEEGIGEKGRGRGDRVKEWWMEEETWASGFGCVVSKRLRSRVR
jgi:hypothetical protein